MPALAQVAKVRVIYEFQHLPDVPLSLVEYAPARFLGATDNFTPYGNVVYHLDSAGNFATVAELPGTNSITYTSPMENSSILGIWYDNKNYAEFLYLQQNGGLTLRPNPNHLAPVYQWAFGVWGPGGYFYSAMGYTINGTTTFIEGRLDMKGKLETLFTFSPAEGYPNNESSFGMAAHGTFYGENQVNVNGPPYFVYKVTSAGKFTKLADIPNTGGPFAPLVVMPDGTVYGSEAGGERYKKGAIYKITPEGQFSIVASFPATGMFDPATLMIAADGNLYGSTNTVPTYLFRLNTVTNQLEQIASSTGFQFLGSCMLTQGSDGKIYGTSLNGGASGLGTIFSVDVGISPPLPQVTHLGPSSGPAGTEVELFGSYLLGTSAVSFNGAPVPSSDILVPTQNAVLVHVPAGATTGPITLTTQNGTVTTTENFTIR